MYKKVGVFAALSIEQLLLSHFALSEVVKSAYENGVTSEEENLEVNVMQGEMEMIEAELLRRAEVHGHTNHTSPKL